MVILGICDSHDASVVVIDGSVHGAGNILFYGDLDTSKSVASGDTFSFSIGTLNIQLD